ncbi:hypothetical protein OOZ19_25525 [Saccharopolyspora sp. NFXS83]|uniref:hypothetical protein n=1 Tax=Saccharopolyspora sp. NFXS83 TaxID=2993560 RepID=UPI00224A85DE|nr:hypothetical protein [Saccharopolyspora sp. NFXS83]MCX2733617.1 hypothetical protein [Saccharopolyspora sp. NFXS83]
MSAQVLVPANRSAASAAVCGVTEALSPVEVVTVVLPPACDPHAASNVPDPTEPTPANTERRLTR